MEFLKTTADLLTFQMVSDELDHEPHEKMGGGISVYSMMDKTPDKNGSISGGSVGMLSLRDTYIPIGLYLDDSCPKNETILSYSDYDYPPIGDDLYEKLVDRVSLKKYSAGKTIKIKFAKSNKTQKNI